MRVTAFSVPPLRNNAYLVVDEGSLEAAVIDPAQGAKKILATLKLAGATVRFILNTHGRPAHTARDAAMTGGAQGHRGRQPRGEGAAPPAAAARVRSPCPAGRAGWATCSRRGGVVDRG